ncbi:MAG: hypothetical protein QNM02_14595 [Acidimicrobiia bacterium]|nr:hypothetical protein [Acidimicrobiia bacterium]
MKYHNVTRVTGSKTPAYFLGRPRSFYRDETAPAIPLSVVWGRTAVADVAPELQLAA